MKIVFFSKVNSLGMVFDNNKSVYIGLIISDISKPS